MTETVKRFRADLCVQPIEVVSAADYARLEQECEDAKCRAELFQRAAEVFREERDAALKQVEALRDLLILCRGHIVEICTEKNAPLPASIIRRIDAAMSTKL